MVFNKKGIAHLAIVAVAVVVIVGAIYFGVTQTEDEDGLAQGFELPGFGDGGNNFFLPGDGGGSGTPDGLGAGDDEDCYGDVYACDGTTMTIGTNIIPTESCIRQDDGSYKCMECEFDFQCDSRTGRTCTDNRCVHCSGNGDCNAPTPNCLIDPADPGQNQCVVCRDNADCGGSPWRCIDNNECRFWCWHSSQCSNPVPNCQTATGRCIAGCERDYDCVDPAKPACNNRFDYVSASTRPDDFEGTCVECTVDETCEDSSNPFYDPKKPYCSSDIYDVGFGIFGVNEDINPFTFTCVECRQDKHCYDVDAGINNPNGPTCVQNRCAPDF